MEKALFKEITVNNFLELECMKPKIQEAQRILSQVHARDSQGFISTRRRKIIPKEKSEVPKKNR